MLSPNEAKKPNVLFILSDDQGSWSLGCYGNQEIKTPNIDKLAEHGVKFENFFCVSPVCSPARASLLTGKIPSQHGVHDYLCDGNGGVNQRPIEYLKEHTGYTDILYNHGYECGISGKWHLGNGIEKQKGFDFWYVHQKGGGPYYNAPMIRDGNLVNEPEYITDVITEEAIGFIKEKRNPEKPFYLSVHYTAPHSPWVNSHPKKYTDMYEACEFNSCPQKDTPHPWALTDIMPGYKNPKENLIGYFASITAMDENIGRLLDTLDEEGILEDTLICFTSDNGFNCGHHGIWGKGNGTFPINMYDSSIKVPFILSHKGVIPNNQVCRSMCSGYDFMPTLLEYLELDNPNRENLPGKSFVKNILQQELIVDSKEIVVVFDEYGPVRMIRTEKYKYVHRYPFGPNELYDLELDAEEDNNLYEKEALKDVVADMKKRLDHWFLKYVDPRIDGAQEPVMGGGQKDLAGVLGPGYDVYRKNTTI
ncbi:MAG: sulfatase-like hydrolase/transferase [Mobilitalea sp.]